MGSADLKSTDPVTASLEGQGSTVSQTSVKPLSGIGISIVIPTFNTEKVAVKVLSDLLSGAGELIREILVIDNASTDGTVAAIEEFRMQSIETERVVRLLRNPKNLGYGGSIKRGFSELTNSGSEYVAVIHSDDQCDAVETLKSMAAAFDQEPVPDVVLASRFTKGADISHYSAMRRAGNTFFNFLTKALSGYEMSDAGTGIMVARASTLKQLPFERLTSSYRFHPQLNILIYGSSDVVVNEVPLNWEDAKVGERFSLALYGLMLLKMLGIYSWNRRVRRKTIEDAVIAADSE